MVIGDGYYEVFTHEGPDFAAFDLKITSTICPPDRRVSVLPRGPRALFKHGL